MLTRKQYELLRFINERLKEAGVPPSFDEMKDALDLRSKSGIHRLITALEERGFIRRLPNRARAIEVIKLPETAAPAAAAAGAVSRRASSRAISARSARGSGGVVDDAERPVAVPVMGRIAAGTPIEALQTRSHTISVPPDMLGSGEHYALEVRGDSMVEAGILDGDMALIQRNDTADTGDIVVALIDEEEATLKRFRRRGASIALEPANASYEVRILPPNRVQIQGKLIGIYRKYYFIRSERLPTAGRTRLNRPAGDRLVAGVASTGRTSFGLAAMCGRPFIADRGRPGPVDTVGPDGITAKLDFALALSSPQRQARLPAAACPDRSPAQDTPPEPATASRSPPRARSHPPRPPGAAPARQVRLRSSQPRSPRRRMRRPPPA